MLVSRAGFTIGRPSRTIMAAAVSAVLLIQCYTIYAYSLSVGVLGSNLGLESSEQRHLRLAQDVYQLVSAVGYRGFIHSFKNAVLRPDEPEYVAKAIESFGRAKTLLERLKFEAAGLGEGEVLGEIEATLDRYYIHLLDLRRLRMKGLSIVEVDEAVRVSDEEALAALSRLLSAAEGRLETDRAATEHFASTMLASSLALTLIIASILFCMLGQARPSPQAAT